MRNKFKKTNSLGRLRAVLLTPRSEQIVMPPILAEIIMMLLLGGVSYLISGWAYRQTLDHLKQRTTLLKLLRDQKLEEANGVSDGR